MKLINEEDYLALRLFDFVQHGFQSFLELAAVFCTCHKRAHTKGEYRLIFKSVRYVSADYTLCKAFGNCGFTDAGFTDKHGVVLALTRKDSYNASYLAVTSDYGVELLFSCSFNKVGAVFCEYVVGILGIVARHGRGFDFRKLIREALRADAVSCADIAYSSAAFRKKTEHDVFDGDVLVLHACRSFFGKTEDCGNL